MPLPLFFHPGTHPVPPGRLRSAGRSVACLVGVLVLASCSGGSATPTAQSSQASPAPSTPSVTPSPATTPSPRPSTKPNAESAPPLGQPACLGSALTVVDADAVTAGGSLEEVFVVRTTGPDCQLSGYPELAFSGADGRPLTVTVDRGGHGLPAGQPGPVTLSRGTSVSFGVATARTGSCQQAGVIRVTLPSVTPVMTVTTAMQVCGGSVGITPVQRRLDADGS